MQINKSVWPILSGGELKVLNTKYAWGSPVVGLLERDFKLAVGKMLKEREEPLFEELKKSILKTMSHQINDNGEKL